MRKLLTILFLAGISLTTTAQIQINSDFNVAAQRSVDGKQYKVVNNKHVPYADTADFLATVPKTRRHIGEIAFIYGSAGKINVWQFVGGIDQPNLQLLTGSFSTNRPYPVQSIAEMLALDSAKVGDVAIVADSSKSYILQNIPASSLSNWIEILSPLLANTDYLLEGTTNQYYTDQRSRNAINAGAGISYDKPSGVITNTFNPIPGNNISITGTMPNKTFGVTGIYNSNQQDSIASKLRSEIQTAAAGGITISQLDSTSSILRDEMKIQAANTGLTSTGGITLVDSTVTILDTIRWTIGAKDYVKITPSSFIINTEDSGLYRRDLIYADTTGTLYKVVGIPDSTIGVSPHLPDYAVTVTIVDVFGDQIFNPSPIIIDKGKNPTLQQVTVRGNTTTEQIISNYNGGSFGFTQNSNKHGFTGMLSYNSSNNIGAAAGFLAQNDVGSIGQLYQGSSTNAYAPDAFLVRGSGAGGMKITADIGRISFNRGLLYTGNAPYEMGAFETDGSFRLNNYKNNSAKDSVLSTDETGKVIMMFNSGVDNAAYHTMSSASDSSYGTWNRPNGTKDTLVVVADGLVSGEYILPIASASTLGGVKIGSGLSIDGSGVLSSPAWAPTGNLGTNPTINFLGTIDNQPLVFRVFNSISGYIDQINHSTSFGYQSLPYASHSIFTHSSAFGFRALGSEDVNTAGGNGAFGAYSSYLTSTGQSNNTFGFSSLYKNTTGSFNNVVGSNALYNATTTTGNSVLGHSSLSALTSGNYNSALGDSSLTSLSSGSYNIGLGHFAGKGKTSLNNTLVISDSTYHMYYKLDSIAGTAPNVIGKDANGFWHVYQAPAVGGSSSGWNLTGNTALSTDFIGTLNDVDLTFKRDGAVVGLITSYSLSTSNVFFGDRINISGSENVRIGAGAGTTFNNSAYKDNVIIGYSAGGMGSNNTAVGKSALSALNAVAYTSNNNTSLGYNSGNILSGGTYNTLIGAGSSAELYNVVYNNSTALGANSKITKSNQVVIGDTNVTEILTYGNLLSKMAVLSADPTTTNIPDGFSAIYKNSTSGNVYLWANSGGTLLKIQLN